MGRPFRLLAVLGALAVGACTASPPACSLGEPATDAVYVVSRGWHVEIGLATDDLAGPLTVFRDIFPKARALMFGYGKKTFFTARVDTLSEYVLGPFPGSAVIQVTGLAVLPPYAYPTSDVMVLRLPPDGARALSSYIWNDLGKDRAGGPRLVAPGNFPGSVFYAARSSYSLTHTCNTWAADALHAAGLPISGAGVTFSGQTVTRVVMAGGCTPEAPPAERPTPLLCRP
ncbi:MAG TPA: DUF2459 domain-containing protein [Acetobacteraceae bacterium]